ncbi:MAG: GDP-L-fucose synthase [Bacteroidota bacterium]|jgi:GDP-L-fucose synthase
MKILVTGGSGFIGKNISVGTKISSKDVDLMDFTATRDFFADHRPDAIIHCAAKHGNFKEMADDKVGFYRECMTIDMNVLEAARLAGTRKLIAMSSVTAFPHHLDKPLAESDLHDGVPHPSCYSYAYAKRMIDVLCRSYNEQYGLNYTCAVLTNMYGPHNNFHLSHATVVSNFIHKCYLAKEAGTDLNIYGDGSPIRDFMFVGDLERIFLDILNHYTTNEPLVISTGGQTSMRQLIEVIVKKMDFQGEVKWGGEKNVGQVKKVTSNAKLLQFLSEHDCDTEFTSLPNGIEQTIQWFEANASKFTETLN